MSGESGSFLFFFARIAKNNFSKVGILPTEYFSPGLGISEFRGVLRYGSGLESGSEWKLGGSFIPFFAGFRECGLIRSIEQRMVRRGGPLCSAMF